MDIFMTVRAFVGTLIPRKNLCYCKAFLKTPLSLDEDAVPSGWTEDIKNVVPDFIPTTGLVDILSFVFIGCI